MSTTTPAAGRRTSTARRVNPTVVIGVVLVVLTVGLLLLVSPHDAEDRATGPTETALTAASVGCPGALPGSTSLSVATGLADVQGDVTLTGGGDPRELSLAPGRVSTVDLADPASVTGTGDLAPGLVAARFGGTQLAAADCPTPTPEWWFTGVGAGARHDSVLELVNPDEGLAVADVTVYGRAGEVDVPELRGITVSGQDSVRLQLGEVLPRRSELALHVVVSRGRLAASVLDQVPSVGTAPATQDFLPSQPAPTTDQVLLGLPRGTGTDVLAVANPGEDEARVTVKVLTSDSAFVPQGIEEVKLAPGSVGTISLSTVLRRAIRDGALGIEVIATRPVTATLRSIVAGDLASAAPVTSSGEPMTLLVPPGRAPLTARMVLADATGVGLATVSSWTADGKALPDRELELKPGQGGVVDLPRGAALVRVDAERAAVHAALLVAGRNGTAVTGFRELLTTALIPDVRPGVE